MNELCWQIYAGCQSIHHLVRHRRERGGGQERDRPGQIYQGMTREANQGAVHPAETTWQSAISLQACFGSIAKWTNRPVQSQETRWDKNNILFVPHLHRVQRHVHVDQGAKVLRYLTGGHEL